MVGLGNSLLTDDGVGLRVIARLRERAELLEAAPGSVVVEEDTYGGLRLMERLEGYQRGIIVDAICTGAPPGTLFELSPDDMPTLHSASAHDVNLPTALRFGREVGAQLPANEAIRLIGIEAVDVLTFNEACTPEVEAAVPAAVERVLVLLAASPHWTEPAGRVHWPLERTNHSSCGRDKEKAR